MVELTDLPAEILAGPADAGDSGSTSNRAQQLLDTMLNGEASFWSAVHAPFMDRDVTREDVRLIVRLGLKKTLGNYRMLTELFNMPPRDYRRFLQFLRQYDCHQPFQAFRSAKASHPTDRKTAPVEEKRAV